MKRFIHSFLFLLSSLMFFPASIIAAVYPLNMYKCVEEKPESPETQTPQNRYRRIPSAPLHCTISETGIEFPASFNQEILYYEITDSEENVYTFGDEASFISTLFTLSGEITIVIATPQYFYLGGVIL